MVKNLSAMQATRVRSLCQKDPLQEGMEILYSFLENPIDRGAWRATEGLQKVRHDWTTNTHNNRLHITIDMYSRLLLFPPKLQCFLTAPLKVSKLFSLASRFSSAVPPLQACPPKTIHSSQLVYSPTEGFCACLSLQRVTTLSGSPHPWKFWLSVMLPVKSAISSWLHLM